MGTNGELVTNRRVPFLMSVPNTMSLVAEIFEKGFVELKDPEMGHLVGEMERHSLLSAPGLALLNNILHNLVSVGKLSRLCYHLILASLFRALHNPYWESASLGTG